MEAPAPVACVFEGDPGLRSSLTSALAYVSNIYGYGIMTKSKATMLAKNLIDPVAAGFKRPADHQIDGCAGDCQSEP